MIKAELLAVCRQLCPKPAYALDRLAEAAGHQILRTPQYHPELQPIENCWAVVKNHCAAKCDYTMAGLRVHLRGWVCQSHARNMPSGDSCNAQGRRPVLAGGYGGVRRVKSSGHEWIAKKVQSHMRQAELLAACRQLCPKPAYVLDRLAEGRRPSNLTDTTVSSRTATYGKLLGGGQKPLCSTV